MKEKINQRNGSERKRKRNAVLVALCGRPEEPEATAHTVRGRKFQMSLSSARSISATIFLYIHYPLHYQRQTHATYRTIAERVCFLSIMVTKEKEKSRWKERNGQIKERKRKKRKSSTSHLQFLSNCLFLEPWQKLEKSQREWIDFNGTS